MDKKFEDETIVCKDCGKEFVFTAGEKEFYERNGLTNKPVRCKECREAKKAAFNKRKESYKNDNAE